MQKLYSEMYLFWLKDPRARSIFIYFIPPPQSYQQSPCHVLYRPEVKGKQQNNRKEQFHKMSTDKTGQYKVHYECWSSEEYVEEGCNGVSASK